MPEASAKAPNALPAYAAVTAAYWAFMLTDGATRLADMFGATDWPGLARLAAEHGPGAVVERTREVERTDPQALRWPRGKACDDATVAVCAFGSR